QRVLYAIAQLAEHRVWHIERVLRYEIDAHTFGPDEPDHLLDFRQQGRLGVVEQQMGFIKKEHELRFFRIANLRKFLEQFRQQPQQQRGIGLGRSEEHTSELQSPDHLV